MDQKKLVALKGQIAPCDTEKPYAFVSYSHADMAYVWEDVVELQRRGYNIWIDKNVGLDEEKSWNEKTAEMISSIRCKLVLFYISGASLTSPPCWNELKACRSPEALKTHNNKTVKVIKIDAVPISDLEQYMDQAYESLNDLPTDIANRRSKAHYEIKKHCFEGEDPGDTVNSAVRQLNRHDPKLEEDYYANLEKCLKSCKTGREEAAGQPEVKLSDPDSMYRKSITLLSEKKYKEAIPLLVACAEQYHGAASLVLAYLLRKGKGVPRDLQRARDLLDFMDLALPREDWRDRGETLLGQKDYAAALAFFLGAGLDKEDGESYIKAFLLWLKLPARNYDLAELCLKDAKRCEVPDVDRYIRSFQKMREKG